MSGLDVIAISDKPDDQTIRDVPLSGGVNNAFGARHIALGQLVEAMNVSLDDPSEPTHREGFTQIRAGVVGLPAPDVRGTGLAIFDGGTFASKMLVSAYAGHGVFISSHPNASGWTEARVKYLEGGLTDTSVPVSSDRMAMRQGNGYMWLLSAVGNVHVMRVDGSVVDCGNGPLSPPRNCADSCYMLGRVFLLHDDALYWSKLKPEFSDLTPEPRAFDRTNTSNVSDAGFINMSVDTSGDAVACIAWRGQSVVCFFETHIEELVFNPATPLQSQRNVISSTIGCSSRDAILQFGDDVLFPDQYGQIRSLNRTVFDTTSGVANMPVGYKFRGEVPQNLNLSYRHRMVAARLDDYAYWWYPRGGSKVPNACMALHLGDMRIDGPWVFDRPFNGMAVGDFGQGAKLFAQDGSEDSPTGKVYCLFDGAVTDNGAAIEYRETSMSYTLGMPESDKRPYYVDFEITGDVGCEASLFLRCNESSDFVRVATVTVGDKNNSAYPLLQSTHPIESSDYPLVGESPKLSSAKEQVLETYDNSDFVTTRVPITTEDLPMHGLSTGPGQGRVVQFRVVSATLGKRLRRVGVRIVTEVQNVDMETLP